LRHLETHHARRTKTSPARSSLRGDIVCGHQKIMALRNYSDASIEMQHIPAAIMTITKELLFNILPFSLTRSGSLYIFAYRQYRPFNYAKDESLTSRMSLLSPPTKNVKANFYPLRKRIRAGRRIEQQTCLENHFFCGLINTGGQYDNYDIRYAQLL
jgi:hypothetical protein